MENKSNQTIRGVNSPLVLNQCSNLIILNPIISGSTQKGIVLYKCKNITILNPIFSDLNAGIYAQLCTGGVRVIGGVFKNMNRINNGGGQAVQFDNCSGSSNLIANNIMTSEGGNEEDWINMYQSSGLSYSPIMITGNRIKGGGASNSGGGIMLGDCGGKYQCAINNKLVDPGQYGLAISGGENLELSNNQVFSKGGASNNVGLYVAQMAKSPIVNPKLSGNKINYTDKNGLLNNWWFDKLTPIGVEYDNTLNESIIFN